MSALEVQDLHVHFGTRRALDGLDLEVGAGEVVAVLGPSGSGKTTLLRAVAGLVPLAGGRIRLAGRDIGDEPTHRRGVGLMFQDHALFGHLDVAGNVAYGLRMRGAGRSERAARVSEVLDLVGLPDAGRRAVRELSGGERQRVALARCLAPRPALVMLDEPFGSLDRARRDQLVGELSGLFRSMGQTVLAVTHDRDEAFALADRLVIVDAGRIVEGGPPAALWRRPRTEVAARLLGLGGVVRLRVAGGHADTPWGRLPLEGPDGTVPVLVHPAGVEVRAPGGAAAGGDGRTGDGAAQDGWAPAEVTAARFRGDRSEVTLRTAGAAGSMSSLTAFVDGQVAPTVGDAVEVRVRPEALMPLAAPPGSGGGATPGATPGAP